MNDNKISRRDFLRLTMLGAGAVTLSACAKATATPGEVPSAATQAPETVKAVEVSMWDSYAQPPQGPTMDKIIALFEKANPSIKINHTKYEANPFETALKTAYSGGDPPDFTEINGGSNAWQYAEAGELVDLTDFVTPFLPTMVPAAIVDLKYQGKLWGVPFDDWIGNLIFYNKQILADNNIDVASLSTWTGFLAACEKLKQAGIIPIAYGNKEGWPGDHWISHLMQRMYGERNFEAVHMRTIDKTITTDLKFTDPPGLKAWQMYRELLDKGYFSPGYLSDDWPTAYKYFFDGKAAFHQTGGWFIGSWATEAPDFPMDYIIFPAIEGYPGKQLSVTSGGVMLVISERGKHLEESKKFLEYWTTEEPNRIWAEDVTGLPFYKFDSKNWNIPELAKKEMQLMQTAPDATKFNDHLMRQDLVIEYVWNASQGVLSGDLTPEQAAQNMEDASAKASQELQGG